MDSYKANAMINDLEKLRDMSFDLDDMRTGIIISRLIKVVEDVIAYIPKEGITYKNSNTCVFCGDEIPEGRQVCPKCNKEQE